MNLAATSTLIVLLAFIVAESAAQGLFPYGKTVVYDYHADVKAGIIEPAPYASDFSLRGFLYVQHDTSNPYYVNAFKVALVDVQFGVYNGELAHYQNAIILLPIPKEAKDILDPFLIIYNDNGEIEGIKIPENESEWSKNFKRAIASVFQLDLSSVRPSMVPHAFATVEKTIYGTCHISYDVHPKVQDQSKSNNSTKFIVSKLHEPKNCSNFVHYVFDHVEAEQCHVEPEDDMSTASRRVFEIEKQNDGIIINNIVAHGVINYFPWKARSEAHYILANQTFHLSHFVVDQSKWPEHVPPLDVKDVPVANDLSYNNPQGNYAFHAAKDLTHSRHTVKLDVQILLLKKMLLEAVKYLEENHLNTKETEWKHGQTINRILSAMSYMNLESLEKVYNSIPDGKTPTDVTMKNIFLGMVPTVGTTASCLFMRNIIRKQKISDAQAISMLFKLPAYVKVPSGKLLSEMDELLTFDVTEEVKKSSILCFSRLIYKTFKNQQGGVVPDTLNKYMQRFYECVKNEKSYEMKMVYLMAIRNIQIGNIPKLLEPIISGDVYISDNIRVHAIWAIKKAVVDDLEYVHKLLWPILADTNLALPLRIAAYDILMTQMPHMDNIMNIYWFMVYEKDEHLYNYHLTNIQNIASSKNPCLRPVREMVRKILRFTRIRPVDGLALSSNQRQEYYDQKYGYGETLKTGLVRDEYTSAPYSGYAEYSEVIARKPVPKIGIYWNVYGLDEVVKTVWQEWTGDITDVIANENVRNVLNEAAKDMPRKKNLLVDLCLTINDQVVAVIHFDNNIFRTLLEQYKQWKEIINDLKMNLQHVFYDRLYEMHAITDIGFMAVLHTKIPRVDSLKWNNTVGESKDPLKLKIQMDSRIWRHGEYAMSIYNPIIDTWHSIRRSQSHDSALPIDVSIDYNHAGKNLKVRLPRLPFTTYSFIGATTQVKNHVTLLEDGTNYLKNCCHICHPHEIVTKGSDKKKTYVNEMDIKDIGLHFSQTIANCESDFTPVTRASEWLRILGQQQMDKWNPVLLRWLVAIRHQWVNDLIFPELGNCQKLIKVEPSIVYPISHVDVNINVSDKETDRDHGILHALSGRKIDVKAIVDAVDFDNTSIRSWNMDLKTDRSQGHLHNSLKVRLTRTTLGDKKLKVCIDAWKNYSIPEGDPLKLNVPKDAIDTKVKFVMDTNDSDECVENETVVIMNIKAEISDEQTKGLTVGNTYNACKNDLQNPYFKTQQDHVPKTWNCIQQAILDNILRKYTVNVTHVKVPQFIISNVTVAEDYIRSYFLPHVSYDMAHLEPGHLEMVLQYSLNTKTVNVSVTNPVYTYRFNELEYDDMLWSILTMNIMYNSVLSKYLNEMTRVCTIYPRVLITGDNDVIPFTVSNQWTLLSGNHIEKSYAVFVKSVQDNKVAVKVHVGKNELELLPLADKINVIVNGILVEKHEAGCTVPLNEVDSYVMKLTKNYEHLIVQLKPVPVTIMYTTESVTLVLDTVLRGHITGLCGHLDHTYKNTIPKIYRAPAL